MLLDQRKQAIEVLRSADDMPGSAMQYLGATGSKSFVDDTIPAGAKGLRYQVTALRSTRRGAPARFGVRFGGSEGGSHQAPLGLAA